MASPFGSLHMGFGATSAGAGQALNGVLSAIDQQATLQQQQQKQQQTQAQQDSKDHMEALNQGAIPLDPLDNSNGAPSNRPTLMKPQDLQPGQDPNRVQEIGGKRFYFPTEQEKAQAKAKPEAALDDSNSFVLPDTLADRLSMKSGTRIPFAHAEAVGHLATMLDQKADTVDRVDLSGDFTDADGNKLPVKIMKSGLILPLDMSGSQQAQPPAVGTVTPAPASGLTQPMPQPQQPGGGLSFNPKQAAEKPEKSKTLLNYEEIASGAVDASPDDVRRAKAVISLHNKNTAGSLAAARKLEQQGEEKPLSASGARQITQKKYTDLNAADAAYAKAIKESVNPEDRQVAITKRQQARQNAQLDYEQSISAATGKDIPHNSWADDPTSSTPTGGGPAPATVAAPAQTTPRTAPAAAKTAPGTPAKKVASMAKVRAYAAKNNLSEADAIRAAKGEGFQIAGQ